MPGNYRLEIYVLLTVLAIVGGAFGAIATMPGGMEKLGLVAPPEEEEDEDAPKSYRLLVFETKTCGWCVKFRRDMAPSYASSSYQRRAPLTYIQMRSGDEQRYKLKGGVRGTPTFVLVDSTGREVGRYPGYPGNRQHFFAFLDKHL